LSSVKNAKLLSPRRNKKPSSKTQISHVHIDRFKNIQQKEKLNQKKVVRYDYYNKLANSLKLGITSKTADRAGAGMQLPSTVIIGEGKNG
jgi:hypothetical protein